jgi:hypothetical protein
MKFSGTKQQKKLLKKHIALRMILPPTFLVHQLILDISPNVD